MIRQSSYSALLRRKFPACRELRRANSFRPSKMIKRAPIGAGADGNGLPPCRSAEGHRSRQGYGRGIISHLKQLPQMGELFLLGNPPVPSHRTLLSFTTVGAVFQRQKPSTFDSNRGRCPGRIGTDHSNFARRGQLANHGEYSGVLRGRSP